MAKLQGESALTSALSRVRLKSRLEQREDATHEISDARLEDFETLTRSYEPPSEVGVDHCFVVATDRPAPVTIEETLEKLVLAGFKSH